MGDEFDEDIFDDLYDEEPAPAAQPAAPAAPAAPVATTEVEPESIKIPEVTQSDPSAHGQNVAATTEAPLDDGYRESMQTGDWNGNAPQSPSNGNAGGVYNQEPVSVKEDGKMFIGGLNWETTEENLQNYFSQFGEVSDCTVMRDSATGRSRGFGFLTFKDAKCVNTVMVKEHYLDGKIIDPKRAIPREEQERTAKIFVGGVSQEASEDDFKKFFQQFGRVIDATLMIDKDTGRPRGFGFVTFDGEAAVDACLQGPLAIHGKPIEVKRAQPRGNMREEEENKKFGRGKFNQHNGGGNNNGGFGGQDANQGGAGNNAMTPAMMAQYWQRMQQYFRQMQQNIAGAQGNGMPNQMMAGMNPAMMGMMGNMGQGGPMPGQMPGQMGGNMNPMMGMMGNFPPNGMNPGGGDGGFGGNNQNQPLHQGQVRAPKPSFHPQDQLAFEQQKYEQQQQQRRMQHSAGYAGQGGPTSWDGMYDDTPPPTIPAGPRGNVGGGQGKQNNRGRQGSSQPPGAQPPNAPANAPTGPKNAGKPGANYRGGGRGGNFRHNPYGGR